MKFDFNDACMETFKPLKEKLISTPVIISPDWSEPFEVMSNKSGTTFGVVLGKKFNKLFNPIYYTSKTSYGVQLNYMLRSKSYLRWFMHLTIFGHTC